MDKQSYASITKCAKNSNPVRVATLKTLVLRDLERKSYARIRTHKNTKKRVLLALYWHSIGTKPDSEIDAPRCV